MRSRLKPEDAGLPGGVGAASPCGAVQSQGVRPALRQLLEAGGTCRPWSSGVLRLRRPIVGEPELNFGNLVLPDDSGQMLRIFSARPGTPSADSLMLLASYGAPAADISAPGGIRA
ncbi:MmyB family transcriptional regulator [Arthrobacter sp. UYCu723]